MPKYKAAIFDLDGTLLDTLDDLCDSVNHTMDIFSYPHRTREEVRLFVGNGVDRLIELSVPGGDKDPMIDEAIREFRRYYADHSEIKTKPYDGVLDITSRLQKEGIGVAVVSNKLHQATVTLCRKYFPNIKIACGEREADGIRRKPYPDMVYKAISEMGVPLSECVYIGDSEVDLATAKNVGIDCISVLWGFRNREALVSSGGIVFVNTAEELYRAITE